MDNNLLKIISLILELLYIPLIPTNNIFVASVFNLTFDASVLLPIAALNANACAFRCALEKEELNGP